MVYTSDPLKNSAVRG